MNTEMKNLEGALFVAKHRELFAHVVEYANWKGENLEFDQLCSAVKILIMQKDAVMNASRLVNKGTGRVANSVGRFKLSGVIYD